MIKIGVEFWGFLAHKIGKSKEIVSLDQENNDLKNLLEKLCQSNGPDFRDLILDEKGGVSGGLTMLVNGKAVRKPADLNQRLKNGTYVVFTYPLMGG